MFLPLIPKDPARDSFTCRDGEIEFVIPVGGNPSGFPALSAEDISAVLPEVSLMARDSFLERTVRIPLQAGDRQKAELLVGGDVTRVDPAIAERLTQAILQKAAETLLDLSVDLRRRGLFILPFRYYTMVMMPDGTLSFPSPQGVALPSTYPPHPEITAASASDDCLTLALRFPVRPHMLCVSASSSLPAGCTLRTFISHPLYIPDPKEMRGSIGSVRSAAGGNAVGIRFSFLTASAVKASVAAPEKYYELIGNPNTGYRTSSKAAAPPDYSCYAAVCGHVPPFPSGSLLAPGEGVDASDGPSGWIADWVQAGEGYLPSALPYIYREGAGSGQETVWPEGIDGEEIMALCGSLGFSGVLLTRPMTLAAHEESRRRAEAKGIRAVRIHGLPAGFPAHAILYGSDDGVRWTPVRRFDPRRRTLVLAPPRLFWRILVFSPSAHMAVEITL